MGIYISQFIKKFARDLIYRAGFEIIPLKRCPNHNLLGLRNFPIRSILDLGAHDGYFAKSMMQFFPQANIYCIEPLPDAFDKLNLWAETKKEKVKAFNLAIGETQGNADMIIHVDHNPSSSLLKTTDHAIAIYPQLKPQSSLRVRIATLDSFVGNLSESLAEDILIKLDVQGYEDRVIRGGTKTFHKARACILEINLDQLYEKQADFHDLINQLYEMGYRYAGNLDQTYSEDGHVIFIDSVFLK